MSLQSPSFRQTSGYEGGKETLQSFCVCGMYMNMCTYYVESGSNVNSFLPADQGLPNRDEEVSTIALYMYMYEWCTLMLYSYIVSLQHVHVDCWIFWKLLRHTNIFTSYGSSAI